MPRRDTTKIPCVCVLGRGALTDDEVPGGGEHQGAGERDAVQAEASRRRPQAAVVQQPNEAAAQAEVDGPAVGDDAVVTLQATATLRVSESAQETQENQETKRILTVFQRLEKNKQKTRIKKQHANFLCHIKDG